MKSCLFLVCCCVFVFDICSTFMLRLLYFENQKKSYFSTRTEKARCTDPSQRDKLKMGRSRAISLPRNVLGLNFFAQHYHHHHTNVESASKKNYLYMCHGVALCQLSYSSIIGPRSMLHLGPQRYSTDLHNSISFLSAPKPMFSVVQEHSGNFDHQCHTEVSAVRGSIVALV